MASRRAQKSLFDRVTPPTDTAVPDAFVQPDDTTAATSTIAATADGSERRRITASAA